MGQLGINSTINQSIPQKIHFKLKIKKIFTNSLSENSFFLNGKKI